jgi:16S rRNA (uracil1498-N3)-methyltransferase
VSHREWPRRVAALGQFRVDDPEHPVLAKVDEHHLRSVLRARTGEEIVVTDGRGSWSLCHVGDAELDRVTPVHHDPAPAVTTLYLAPLKGDRSEWAVAKATELGVSRIVPLVSARVMVKFKGETRDKIVTRWRRIAAESCGQCRRTFDVEVGSPVDVAQVPDDVCITDFDGESNWNDVSAVAIGPEGGWAPDEWSAHRRRLALGPTVLRAETAGVVAAALLAFGAGGWGFTLDAQASQ